MEKKGPWKVLGKPTECTDDATALRILKSLPNLREHLMRHLQAPASNPDAEARELAERIKTFVVEYFEETIADTQEVNVFEAAGVLFEKWDDRYDRESQKHLKSVIHVDGPTDEDEFWGGLCEHLQFDDCSELEEHLMSMGIDPYDLAGGIFYSGPVYPDNRPNNGRETPPHGVGFEHLITSTQKIFYESKGTEILDFIEQKASEVSKPSPANPTRNIPEAEVAPGCVQPPNSLQK